MKGRSTTSNLLSITQFISESIDSQLQTDVIYTDFSKAFDRLNHPILLTKLKSFGLSHSLITLLNSYLSHRSQYVFLNGFKSVDYWSPSGVPQGSILGPLLFNIFINDIVDCLDVRYLLYADDLKLFSEIRNIEDCMRIQYNLNLIESWCDINKLPMNPLKCNVMSFTLKSNTIEFNYNFSGSILSRPDTFRDLGVIFDRKLSFNCHIDKIISEASRSYGFLVRNCKDFVHLSTLKTLYYCFVRSKLEYAVTVWIPHHQSYITALEAVQRRFLKYLSFKSDGVFPPIGFPQNNLLHRHNLVSLEARRHYQSVHFLSKLLKNQIDCPDLLQKLNFFVPRYCSRENNTFYAPTPRTDVLKFSPIYVMCNFCNSYMSRLDIFNVNYKDLKSLCYM